MNKIEFNKKNENIFLIIFSIILIIIAGFRPLNIGKDILVYRDWVNQFKELPVIQLQRAEPMFYLILAINRIMLNENFRNVLVIFAVLGVSIKVYGIRRIAAYPIVSLLLYIVDYYILHEMIQIRIGVATGIFILSIPDIQNKNAGKFLLKFLIAFMFHYSILLLLPIFFLDCKKINLRKYFLMILIAFLSTYTNIIFEILRVLTKIIPSQYTFKLRLYMYNIRDYPINLFNFKVIFILSLLTLVYFGVCKINLEYDIIFLKMLCLSLVGFYIFSFSPVLAFRIFELYGVVSYVYFSDIIMRLGKGKYLILLLYVFINVMNVFFIQRLIDLNCFKLF